MIRKILLAAMALAAGVMAAPISVAQAQAREKVVLDKLHRLD